jgi:hypothetical protein
VVGWLLKQGSGREEGSGVRLQEGATTVLRLLGPPAQLFKEAPHLLPPLGRGPPAGVRGHLLADPVPAGRVGVVIRAVPGPGDQAQAQVRRGQGGAPGLPGVGRAVVPEHEQRFRVVGPPLAPEGRRGLGGAGGADLPLLDLPALPSDRRLGGPLLAPTRAGRIDPGRLPLKDPAPAPVGVGADGRRVDEAAPGAGARGLRTEGDVARPQRLPLGGGGVAPPLLGTPEHDPQPGEGLPAAAARERPRDLALDEGAAHLPVPIRQRASPLARGRLPHGLQRGRGVRVADGGEPPVGSTPIPSGPASPQVARHPPIGGGPAPTPPRPGPPTSPDARASGHARALVRAGSAPDGSPLGAARAVRAQPCPTGGGGGPCRSSRVLVRG